MKLNRKEKRGLFNLLIISVSFFIIIIVEIIRSVVLI